MHAHMLPATDHTIADELRHALADALPPYTLAQVDDALAALYMGMDAARQRANAISARPFIVQCQREVDLLSAFRAGLAQGVAHVH